MLVLDLPPQIQIVIEQNAREAGISPELLATKLLSAQLERVEQPFNFDLDEMEQAINSGFKPMPDFKSDEEFLAWANA